MRRFFVAAVFSLITGLAGCSGGAPAAPATAPAVRPSGGSAVATTSTATSPQPARSTPDGFTVDGSRPVPANGSQDTKAQAAGASCDSATMAADRRLGGEIANGFSVASLPASAGLLRHFLAGEGTAVGYPAGSAVSRLAMASAAFAAADKVVKAAVTQQLKAGSTRVRLSAGQLPLVPFDSGGGDLYWGFRGTQGLSVTGRGQRAGGGYAGTLTYVIRDSYGFPEGDTLGGFGAPMRYLQTVCGAPQHAGGAHWFPDTITVTVPFRQPG
jgi:hypothetical protein